MTPPHVACEEFLRDVEGLGHRRLNARSRTKGMKSRLPVDRQKGQPESSTLLKLLLGDDRIAVNVQDLKLETPLHYACTSYGSGPLVKRLRDRGAKLERRNAAGDTPLLKFLHSAFRDDPFPPPKKEPRSWQSEDFSLFELLLERGANVKAAGRQNKSLFGLLEPTREEYTDILKIAFQHAPDEIDSVMANGKAGLLHAVQTGNANLTNWFAKNGANVEARNMAKETMTYVAISQRADAMAKKSRPEAEETPWAYRKLPLYHVTSTTPTESAHDEQIRKYATVVSYLIRHGRPDVGFMPGNTDGETCLTLASRTNQVDVVEKLLQKYALSPYPQRQPLAVHYSVNYGAYDSLVRILEHHRNDPDRVGEGNLRPLHQAIHGNNISLMSLLTRFGRHARRAFPPSRQGFHVLRSRMATP